MKFIKLFKSPLTQWSDIRLAAKGNSGVYAIINNVTGDVYIGSATCLYSRLRDYFQDWYQEQRGNTIIVRAMKKYGLDSFSVAILEYTDKYGAVAAEQRWIDQYEPAYNILKKASSSLGYVHRPEDKEKISQAMTGKLRSDTVKMEMSQRQTGMSNTFYGKTHSDDAKAKIRLAAIALSSSSGGG